MRGIQLEGRKEQSLVSWAIARPSPPEVVNIPLIQRAEESVSPCVTVGQKVRVGEMIGTPHNDKSVAVHASISGMVTKIENYSHDGLEEAPVVEIRSDGHHDLMPHVGEMKPGWENYTQEQILKILKNSGVVGMSGEMEAVHEKNAAKKHGKIHTLILNGCESEPYVTCDHSLMMSRPLEIIKGAEILRKVIGAERIILAIEDNKLEVAELLKSKVYFLKWEHFEVRALPTKYPQGAKMLLAQSLFGVSPVEFKSGYEDTLQFHNVTTAHAVYEAVALQKPVFERPVTIGGECIVEARNVWVPIGTSLKEATKFCKGLLREPRKVLTGGPMTGKAEADLSAPVMKGTQAILALPKEAIAPDEVEGCIRCQKCVEACPVEISPVMITLAAEIDDFEMAAMWGSELCIECGNCSFVCPSKRPMVELIRYADTQYKLNSEEELFEDLDQAKPGLTIEAPKKTPSTHPQ